MKVPGLFIFYFYIRESIFFFIGRRGNFYQMQDPLLKKSWALIPVSLYFFSALSIFLSGMIHITATAKNSKAEIRGYIKATGTETR